MGVITREGRYIARFRDERGRKREHSFGYGDQARLEAEKYCQKWENYHEQMRQYRYEQEIAADPNTVTFGKLVDEYIQQCKVKGCSENHCETLRYVADGVFFPQLGKDTPVVTFDYARHILPFLEWLQTTPRANGKIRSVITCNKYANFLKTFFNYAVKRGYIDKNPMSFWVKQFEPKRPRILDREMIEKIIANAPRHLAWAIEVAYNCGARTGPSELLNLKWSDVDYEHGILHIWGNKTKQDRWVPLSEEFLARLREHRQYANCEYIVEYAGRHVDSLSGSFRTACRKAGISDEVIMYDVRHRFASELFNSNVPIGVVSKAIGHTRVSTTTDVYLEVLPKEIYGIRGKLPALNLPDTKHEQTVHDEQTDAESTK